MSGQRQNKTSKRSFEDLDQEAKDVYYSGLKHHMTKEEFMKDLPE